MVAITKFNVIEEMLKPCRKFVQNLKLKNLDGMLRKLSVRLKPENRFNFMKKVYILFLKTFSIRMSVQ